jgi:hypothetical protein
LLLCCSFVAAGPPSGSSTSLSSMIPSRSYHSSYIPYHTMTPSMPPPGQSIPAIPYSSLGPPGCNSTNADKAPSGLTLCGSKSCASSSCIITIFIIIFTYYHHQRWPWG